ncbi:MAG: sensor histidine kinase [Leptolyngbyaceae cyanobacterium T60_A2020_046]|nr:sensor histidine kinase [Leptolyngbyaceae cyanobacterium T60_A2020_046]
MNTARFLRPGNHPFPFLLHLEWVLLGIAVLSEMTPVPIPRQTAGPGVAIAALLCFGALGLRLPAQFTLLKGVLIAAQFVLILLASQAGLAGLRLFPFLYLIVLIRSCLILPLAGRIGVLCITIVVFASVVQLRLQTLGARMPFRDGRRLYPVLAGIQVNFTFLFVVLLVFVLLMVNALLAERQRREDLREANDKLRDSAAQIEALAMAQERSRIAREIHDSLGHSLTALNIQLEGAVKLWEADPPRAREFLMQAKQLGSTALGDVRQAVATVRANPLRFQRLEEAIADVSQQFAHATGITPTLRLSSLVLPPSIQVNLYRIVQEALTNISKHAAATTVDITLQSVPPDHGGGLSLTIRDNGRGFFLDDNRSGFGLNSMKERAEAEGGRFQLISAPGEGCTLQVWLPWVRS